MSGLLVSKYRHNHYVPVWYQRRFMHEGQDRYFRLDLQPEIVNNGKKNYARNALHEWSPDRIFAEGDLYTTRWESITNTEIERFFFGKLDNDATNAVDYFANLEYPSSNKKAFNTLLSYMSVQKLRTPKGTRTCRR